MSYQSPVFFMHYVQALEQCLLLMLQQYPDMIEKLPEPLKTKVFLSQTERSYHAE
jgi:hypothetical protein